MKRTLIVLLLAFGVAQTACVQVTASRTSEAPSGAQTAVSDRLYFGRNIPSSEIVVSESDWERFLGEIVTPRFPDGLTFTHAHGQWKDASGKITSEQVFILEIVHPVSAVADSAIAQIARAYKQRFRQDAVLQIRANAVMRFY